MISLRRPSNQVISKFLEAQSQQGFSYPAVGATASLPPSGYQVDQTRIKLGEGERVFDEARAALGRWDQFRLGWVETFPTAVPIQVGEVVTVVARQFGLWWLSACRIVYLVDDDGPNRRAGFAYGTLPDHAESGEERFMIEWDRSTGDVWYDILAFSRPQWLLTRLGYPYVRRVQKRFARESAAAMVKAVQDVAGAPGNRPLVR